MTQPRFVFFGTPRFARIILETLEHHGLSPVAIITAPPKPQGRHLVLTPSETELWAKERKIPVFSPLRLKENKEFFMELQSIDADIFVVAAYGKILPKEILDLPTHKTINVHPSLLPKFRGASPIESVILSDETFSGVTIMLLDEELDHGPILAQSKTILTDWPPRKSELLDLLAQQGGELLAQTIPEWTAGNIAVKEQQHDQATYTKKIEKADAEIDPENDPYGSFKKIRAFDAGLVAWMNTVRHGKNVRIKITDAEFESGRLKILRVIPEGKKEMLYSDFLRGA